MSEPRERPILFSGPMVRALLEGRKTQTRRVVKLAGTEEAVSGHFYPSVGLACFGRADGRQNNPMPCPFGKPGDLLWVRETWRREEYGGRRRAETLYRADMDEESEKRWAPWKPSIHMPRWASRLLLQVTEVRVQRLQEISEEDVRAEGCQGGHDAIPGYGFSATPREHFRALWDSLDTSPGGDWSANPWVWAVSFRRVEGSR